MERIEGPTAVSEVRKVAEVNAAGSLLISGGREEIVERREGGRGAGLNAACSLTRSVGEFRVGEKRVAGLNAAGTLRIICG